MGFTAQHLFFDDVKVGDEWESLGRTVTEADLVNFAGLSGDFNPIHVDHEFARKTPFRQVIAHGLLVFSIGSGLTLYCPPMRTLRLSRDSRVAAEGPGVRGRYHPRPRPGRRPGAACAAGTLITWDRVILNQAGKVVQQGQTQTLVEGRASLRVSIEDRETKVENQQSID